MAVAVPTLPPQFKMTQLQLQMGQIEELGPSGPSYKTICQSRVDPKTLSTPSESYLSVISIYAISKLIFSTKTNKSLSSPQQHHTRTLISNMDGLVYM